MTPAETLRIHCAALGFLAVILKDVPVDNQELRAKGIARLIESFCYLTVPCALYASNPNTDTTTHLSTIDQQIDSFKAGLRDRGDARLPDDRETLVAFFECLQQRQALWKTRHFLATGSNDMIANAILHMIDQEIEQEGE